MFVRIGRVTYLTAAAALGLLGLGLDLLSAAHYGTWLAPIVQFAVPGRLKDLGLSGWWAIVPWLLAATSSASLTVGWTLAVLASGIPLLAAMLLLSTLPGQPGRNRFGAPPRSNLRFT